MTRVRGLLALLMVATGGVGCAVGIGHTGAAWNAYKNSDATGAYRSDDQSGVAAGYERVTTYTHDFEPSNGVGVRFGVYGGYKYGRQYGTYAHSASGSGGIAAEAHLDGVVAWSRLALILTYGQIGLNFDKPEDTLDATEWVARFSYALTEYFSVNAGAGLFVDPSFTRDNMRGKPGSGHSLVVGTDFFVWQNWFLNIGVKLDASYATASAPFTDGTNDSFSGATVTLEPYMTIF